GHVTAAGALRQGRPDSAVVHARRALRLNPSYTPARLLEGETLLRMGRVEEAATRLQALAIDSPGVGAYQAAWGRALLQLNRAAEALPILERSLDDPKIRPDADVHYQIGLARAQLGQMREALGDFERAVALDPGHYDAWLRVALSHYL